MSEPRQVFLPGRQALIVRLNAQAGKRAALLDLLNTYADGLAEEPGTEMYMVSVDPDDDDLVWLALGPLHVKEALGTGTTGLVHDHHGLLHEVVLLHHALDEAGHLVGAAAGTGRNDELHRPGGFPRQGGGTGQRGGQGGLACGGQAGDPVDEGVQTGLRAG